MSQLSADVGNRAAPHAIEHAGVRYEFKHLGAAQLAEYQRRRFERERDQLRLLRDDYQPAEYALCLDQLRERFDRGEFDLYADVERAGLKPDADGQVPDLSALDGARQARTRMLVLGILAVMTGRSDEENWKLFTELPAEAGQMLAMVLAESSGRPTQAAGQTGTPAAAN